MRAVVTRTQVRTYEVELKNYPPGVTVEEAVEMDCLNALDDPDLFFDDCDSTVESRIEGE